jgi:glutaconate CoA-transferase subunit B
MSAKWNRAEMMICVLARMIEGLRNVAVGTVSPIPAAAALLVQKLSGGFTRASILGSRLHNPFNDGGAELHDRAGQGRIDAFFLSGGQIDGEANINLVGTGEYPRVDTRFPGSFGSAYLYFVIPRVILFREEHSRRVFVPKVDFISAPGWSPPGIWRVGGPYALVTSLCVFAYDRDRHRFRLESLHPGTTLEEVRDNTGFAFDVSARLGATPAPEPDRLALIRSTVAENLSETYPTFAATTLGYRPAA